MDKISIIVPVFRVEPYLRQCLDSLCGQTLQNLEFLLIDDGSPDGCGAICDEYAARDPRVTVFHTENHGLSMARNLGLDAARKNGSAFVGFVDSDDWVEPDMFEALYDAAVKYQADVVECGLFVEWPNNTEVWYLRDFCVCDAEAGNYAHVWKSFSSYAWNKLWRISCFEGVQYPAGRYYEDEAIIMHLINNSKKYCFIHEIKYHYRRRADSIASQKDMKMLDLWISRRDNLQYIKNVLPRKIDEESLKELENNQIKLIVQEIGRIWVWWITNPREEQEKHASQLREMRNFVRENVPVFGMKDWTQSLRLCSFLCRWDNRLSLTASWAINQIDRIFRKDELE